jgi:prevent-host-death family protein
VSTTIPQRELRNQNAEIIAAVIAGESFVVTRNGAPVAELRPVHGSRRTFVARAELADLGARGSHIDRARFRADLDHAADQGVLRWATE